MQMGLLLRAKVDEFWAADAKLHLVEYLDKQQFRVADVGMSYRQIQLLNEHDLLPKKTQSREGGWRKFTFKELVFLRILSELKEFGMRDEQFVPLFSAFFRQQTARLKVDDMTGRATESLGFVLLGNQVNLAVFSTGSIVFFDVHHLPLFLSAEHSPFVFINLNQIVNEILREVDGTEHRYMSLLEMMKDAVGISLNKKEARILELIRSGDFESIEIKQSDGDVRLLTKTKVIKNPLTALEIAQIMKANRYSEIRLHTQDGKNVGCEIADKEKL